MRWIAGSLLALAVVPGCGGAHSPTSEGRPALALLSSRDGSQGNYRTVTGAVENLSTAPLDRLQVLVTWRDRAGRVVSTDSALVEYRPLQPEQTSPFKTMTRATPEMVSYSLAFRTMAGGMVAHVDRRPDR